ncbi:MAG: response regulator [Pirellulales bacterium]
MSRETWIVVMQRNIANFRPQHSYNVLVVDHRRPVGEMLERWLRAAGCRTTVVCDLKEARTMIESATPDLLIADIDPPDRMGFELLHQFQADEQDIPVLMLASPLDPREAVRALSFGAWGYLLKPLQLRDVLFQTQRVLQRRHLSPQAELRVLQTICKRRGKQFDAALFDRFYGLLPALETADVELQSRCTECLLHGDPNEGMCLGCDTTEPNSIVITNNCG